MYVGTGHLLNMILLTGAHGDIKATEFLYRCFTEQEAQLSQRIRAMPRVVEYFC